MASPGGPLPPPLHSCLENYGTERTLNPSSLGRKGDFKTEGARKQTFFLPRSPGEKRDILFIFFKAFSFFSRSRQYWIPQAVQVCVQKFPVLPLLLLSRLNEIGIFNGNFFPLSLSCGKARILCARWIQTSRGFFFCVSASVQRRRKRGKP